MSRICFGSWLVAAVLLMPVESEGRYSGGDGSPEFPYRIGTPNDLNDIGNHVEDFNKCFVMVNDVNLAAYTGTEFNIIGYWKTWYSSRNIPFVGVFDGNNHTVSNFTYSPANHEGVGLFAYLGSAGQIRDLTLLNVDVNAPNRYGIGGLVGCCDGTISDCLVSGRVNGKDYVGGLVGSVDGEITGCATLGTVSASSCDIGGLAGGNYGSISGCHSGANVNGNDFTGGLVGGNYTHIANCSATGDILAPEGWMVGGLVGYHGADTISNSWASGNVYGYDSTGGLAGENNGEIINCYATGPVNGTAYYTGGLIGRNYWLVYNCYGIGRVSGTASVGGLIGVAYSYSAFFACFWNREINPDVTGVGTCEGDCSGVVGKTIAEMQTESTFTDAGWDFVTPIWKMCDEATYPMLWWEECPVLPLELVMKFTPPALNVRSKAKWVKAHLVLPEGYALEDVDTNTPCKITEPVEPDIESDYINVFINEDGLVEIEAAFERRAFCQAGLSGEVVEVRVEGKFISGQGFFGTDTVRVIDNTFGDLGVMASYWLEGGCSQPDWCGGSDINQDSAIDLVDFALLGGCCVEVIGE